MTPIRWFFSFIFWNFFQGSFLWHRIFCLIKILLIWCIKAHLFPSVWVLECILTNNSVILASHRVISYCSDAITISQHQRQPNWRKMQQHFQAHFQTGLNCLQILHFYLLFNKEIQCRDFFSSLSPARRWKQRTIKFISRLGSDKIIKWLLRRWDSVLSSFIFLSDRKNETHGALALYPCPINPTWKMWGGWGKKGKIQKGARSFYLWPGFSGSWMSTFSWPSTSQSPRHVLFHYMCSVQNSSQQRRNGWFAVL